MRTFFLREGECYAVSRWRARGRSTVSRWRGRVSFGKSKRIGLADDCVYDNASAIVLRAEIII